MTLISNGQCTYEKSGERATNAGTYLILLSFFMASALCLYSSVFISDSAWWIKDGDSMCVHLNFSQRQISLRHYLPVFLLFFLPRFYPRIQNCSSKYGPIIILFSSIIYLFIIWWYISMSNSRIINSIYTRTINYNYKYYCYAYITHNKR